VELELGHALFQPVDISRDGLQRGIVAFGGRQFQQLAGIVEAMDDLIEPFHELGKARAFAAQVLGALRIVPDVRAFQLAGYFFEAFALGRVVKDTP